MRRRLTSSVGPTGKLTEMVFHAATFVAAISVLTILLAIIFSLVWTSLPIFLQQGLGFFTSTSWDPIQEVFGALPSIYGTLITSLIAMLIAIPVSFGPTVGRYSQYHLRHVGAFCFCAHFCKPYRTAFTTPDTHPFSGCVLCRAAIGDWSFARRHYSGHHGHPVYQFSHAGRF